MLLDQRITFSILKSKYLTHLKDNRAVERWCISNKIPVYKDLKFKYVWDEDFFNVYYATGTPEQKEELIEINRWNNNVLMRETLINMNNANASTKKTIKPSEYIPLVIPKDKQVIGLYISCQVCSKEDKSELKIPYNDCDHPANKQVFKAKIHISGTKNKVKTRNFPDVRDLDQAIKLTEEFRKEIDASENLSPSAYGVDASKSLKKCMEKYLTFIIDKHSGVKTNHIKEVEFVINLFMKSIESYGLLPNLNVENITEMHAKMFKNYMISFCKYRGATFNSKMSKMGTFIDYLNLNGFKIINPFTERAKENKNGEIITADEFYGLLNFIKESDINEKLELKTGEKKQVYFPYLAQGIELALRTGVRNEEYVTLKYSDIVYVKNVPTYFKVENFKVNRLANVIHEADREFKYIPITKKLLAMLELNGLKKYSKTDKYIVAPESDRLRDTIKKDISVGFAHFYTKLYGKYKAMKCLRKTYSTQAWIFTRDGNVTNELTGHAGMAVLYRHYINRAEVAIEFAKKFEVF